MSQIQSKFLANNAVTAAKIANDSVTEAKIRLQNNAYLKARNAADSANVDILKVNASDAVEFASFPQKSGTPTLANELVNKSYVDGVLAGLSWKSPVRAASTANVAIATALENGDTLDGVTLATNDRVLLKDQTAGEEDGIYIVQATGAAVRATDMDSAAETLSAAMFISEGTVNGGKGYVQTAVSVTLGTTPLVFVQFSSTVSSIIGGDMITVSGSTISVDLHSTSGLESSNAGNVAGQLRVKLEASNPSLQIDGSNQLGAKLDAAGAVVSGASGLAVQLESSNPTLQIASNRLGAKLNAAGAIITGAGGLAVQVDTTSIKISSNTLSGLTHGKQTFTLNGTDITNQYIDLSQVAKANSIYFAVKGAGALFEGASHEYSVSLTGGAGGNTRITFLNDIATGGNSALIAGDLVQVSYMYI